MKIFKNFLILFIVFLYANVGNAELIGGHDRQRLNLIFSDLINQRLKNSPISISTAQFPITLVSNLANQPIISLYNVLAEEGYLTGKNMITGINDHQASATQAIQYTLNKTDTHNRIAVCTVLFDSITTIERMHSDDDDVRYKVSFQWRAQNLAPWIWAPSLENNSDIAKVKRSETNPSHGEATMIWQVDRWILSLNPLIN
jgi:hypothetical protein